MDTGRGLELGSEPEPELGLGPGSGSGLGPGSGSGSENGRTAYVRGGTLTPRPALLWKLDGLSEYDVRRPLTPTGTNLLGLVKHAAGVELGYLGDTFGRPSGEPLPWLDGGAEPNADMWAPADESRAHLVDLYRRAWAHADATIDALPLDTVGRVPWWPDGKDEVTLHHAVIRVTADAHRHAGHTDILRERDEPGQHQPAAGRRGVVGGVPGPAGGGGPGGDRPGEVTPHPARTRQLP